MREKYILGREKSQRKYSNMGWTWNFQETEKKKNQYGGGQQTKRTEVGNKFREVGGGQIKESLINQDKIVRYY